jgi:multimeric flavodoxin WrbA
MGKFVLIIKGSPRVMGNSSMLADKAAEGAIAAGAQVESYMLHGMDIRPCDACDTCQEIGDVQNQPELLQEAFRLGERLASTG